MSAAGTQQIRFDILIDMQAALPALRQLLDATTNNQQKIVEFTTVLENSAKKWGISILEALAIWRQFNASLSSSHQATVFGNVGGQPIWTQLESYVKSAQGAAQDLGKTGEESMNRWARGIDVVRIALGTLVAMLVFRVMQSIQDTFTNAIKYVEEYEIAIYNAKNAERVLSEAGLDITFKDLEDVVDRLHTKFLGLFPKLEIQDVVSDIAVATKDLGFGAKQIEMLTQSIAAVQLRQPDKTLQQVSQHALTALLSGRTQALQQMGVAANEATVQEKALAMGLIHTGEQLDPQTKALAILQILYDSTAKEVDKVADRQNTLAGVTQTLTSSWKDFLTNVGIIFSPAIIKLIDGVVGAFKNIGDVLVANTEKARAFGEVLAGTTALLGTVLKDPFHFARILFTEGLSAALAEDKRIFVQGAQFAKDYFDSLSKGADTATSAVDKSKESLVDLSKVKLDSLISSVMSLADQLIKLDRTYATRSQQDLQDYNIKIARMQQDYQISVTQAIRGAADQRKQIEQKYRDNEVSSEAKFQEQMRQLRAKYLFDLEDALRARDARQVLRLQAQFRMNQDNLVNEHALEVKQNQKQYQEDIQNNQDALKQKLADMAAAEALKEQRAAEDFNLEQARRKAEYEQQRQDLLNSWDEKLKMEAQKLGEQLGLNQTQIDALYQVMKQYFGPQGLLDGLYDYSYESMLAHAKNLMNSLQQIANGAMSYMQSLAQIMSSYYTANPGGYVRPPVAGGGIKYASGGMAYADKPTTLTFGEGGAAEVAMVLPANKAGATPKFSASTGLSGAANGHVLIDLVLSPDLEARIRENTLDEAANVVARVRRSK